VHQTAVAYRGQNDRKRKVTADYTHTQLTLGHGYCVAGAERDFFKCVTVLSQSELAVGSAIQIVKNHPGQTATGQQPEIGDVHNPGRFN
jgi:hypothetical protein